MRTCVKTWGFGAGGDGLDVAPLEEGSKRQLGVLGTPPSRAAPRFTKGGAADGYRVQVPTDATLRSR